MKNGQPNSAVTATALTAGLIDHVEQFIRSIAPHPKKLVGLSGDELLEGYYQQANGVAAEFVEAHLAEPYMLCCMNRDAEKEVAA